jgi:hypothetical protein
MEHSSAVHGIVALLCSSSSSTNGGGGMLLKDASALLRHLLLSPQLASSLKVKVLDSLLACARVSGAADADVELAAAEASQNVGKAIMTTSILHMFLVDAQQPLPHHHALAVAGLAVDALTMMIRISSARDVLQVSHAASQSLQLHAISLLLLCLPSPATPQSSAELKSPPLLTAASSLPPPSSPPPPSIALSHSPHASVLLRVTRDRFIISIMNAAAAAVEQGGQSQLSLVVKDCLTLIHRIAIHVSTSGSSGSIACELEATVPQLFVCLSRGQTHAQHGAMLCLQAMFQGSGVFPNAIQMFLEMDGYSCIFRMMKSIVVSSSSSPSLFPLSSSSETSSCKLLPEGFALTFFSLNTVTCSHMSSGLSLLVQLETAGAVDDDMHIDGESWHKGQLELLICVLRLTAARASLKARGWDDFSNTCESTAAIAAVRYLRRTISSRSSALSELLLLLLPLLQPDRISPPIQIEVSDAMTEATEFGLTLLLQNPSELSQIVTAAKLTACRDVKSSLVKLLSRLFFNCPSVQQEIIRLNALPLLHEISAVPASTSSSIDLSKLISELSRSRMVELHSMLHPPDTADADSIQAHSKLDSRRTLFPFPMQDPVATCFSSAWLSPLNGSIWRLDSDKLSEQMTAISALITDASSARSFSQGCGGGVGLVRPLIENGHTRHQAAFLAVMRALCNSVAHTDIRKNRLVILSLFPDGHWPCVVTSILSMVALHPPCASQARLIFERLCGDAHGQLGLSIELLQLKAFELQATFERRGSEAEDVPKGFASRPFPGDGSCMNFRQGGLRFAQSLAQIMMNDVCADLLEAGRPENVQLLRAYLTLEHEGVAFKDWLGATLHL